MQRSPQPEPRVKENYALPVYCNRHKDFDILQCDEDSVFTRKSFGERCADNGLELRFSTSHRHRFKECWRG